MSETTSAAPSSASLPRHGRALVRVFAVVAMYYAILGYPPLRLADLLVPEWRPQGPVLAAVFVLPAAGWLLYQRWRNPLTRLALRVTYAWLGVCWMALFVVAAGEVLGLALGLDPLVQGAGSLAATLALAGIGFTNALRLPVRRIAVAAPGLERPLRLVQLSDVHVGSRGGGFLARIVARTNALAPDCVLITGDLVDLARLPPSALAPLARLAGPSYFAIGNHERYIDADRICREIAGHGVRVLRNEARVEGPLQIIGIDDAERRDQVARELARIPIDRSRFPVLLYHRPDGLEAAARAGVGLMLSGHTHNGQIVPFNLLVRRVFARICGRYESGRTVLYVSPGTGTWGPPLRLGSCNELTEITLCPREPPAP